ncbi:MAG: hypothetical protein LBV18_05055 [Alistipes sp.]|jgi:hypothetical protein|nr:hypothetical protein [Alistipes sp.]
MAFFEKQIGIPALPNIYRNATSPTTRAEAAALELWDAIEPDWSGASTWENELAYVTEVPTRLTRRILYTTLVENGIDTVSLVTQAPLTRILLAERKDNDSIGALLVTFLPNEGYESDLTTLGNDPEGSDYSGITLYSLPDGTPQWGWMYERGEFAGTLHFDPDAHAESDPNISVAMAIDAGAATRNVDGLKFCDCSDDCVHINGPYPGDTIAEPITCTCKAKHGYILYVYIYYYDNYVVVGGGGGGVDIIPGGGGTPGPPPPVAPNAKKLFRNNGLDEDDWKKLENLLKKIIDDCMGGNLFNGLDAAMGDGTLNINVIDNSLINGGFGNGGITITDLNNSGALFHEMFHAYQAYQESAGSFGSSSANREVEANIAEYRYFGSLTGNSYDQQVVYLSDRFLSKNGGLIDSSATGQAIFNHVYTSTALQIQQVYEHGYGNPTPFDPNRSFTENFKNLQHLSKGC